MAESKVESPAKLSTVASKSTAHPERSTQNSTPPAVLDALASLQAAFAVVCSRTDTTLFVSDGLQQLLPAVRKGAVWRECIAEHAQLLLAYDKAVSADAGLVSPCDLHVAGTEQLVEFKPCADDQLLVSMQLQQSVADDLHEYMLARDNLFSTSRTISVSEMATTLAHELNTPIGTISNILRGVKMRLKKPDAALDTIDTALDRALEQTQFSQNIISRIRDFTQSRRPKLSVLDVREQVEESIALLDWLLSHHSCQVLLDLPDEPMRISGDATMLQQVLINLIRNAVDAMHQQSIDKRKINIAIAQADEKITVSIADTGHGLSENNDKLFVPFATSKSSGMGVGLNICRSFIELHQGRLWLSPNDVDGCTCFVELPAALQRELERSSSE